MSRCIAPRVRRKRGSRRRQDVRAVERPGAAGPGRDGAPRHLRVRALPRTRDYPRGALPVRRAARPVARARQEGSRPSNRRAPARTGGRENVLRPAARWPSLGGPGLGRFLYCFLPNSPDRVVTRRRGSACNTLSAIRALPAIRRGKAAFWSAHATAPGHQQRHRCCSSWPG